MSEWNQPASYRANSIMAFMMTTTWYTVRTKITSSVFGKCLLCVPPIHQWNDKIKCAIHCWMVHIIINLKNEWDVKCNFHPFSSLKLWILDQWNWLTLEHKPCEIFCDTKHHGTDIEVNANGLWNHSWWEPSTLFFMVRGNVQAITSCSLVYRLFSCWAWKKP